MEGTLARVVASSRPRGARPRGALARVDLPAVGIWALAFALVAYLGLNGGGYDVVVRGQVGVAVWWALLAGAAVGAVSLRGMRRSAWVALALLAAFAAWTAAALLWTESTERTLVEVARLATYVGTFALALAVCRARPQAAARHAVHALNAAIALVVAVAVLSRLRPGLFPDALQTAAFLPGSQSRLAFPLNYWNALAAFAALGIPLALASAWSARTLAGRALAAAPLPLLGLCISLTLSRGGVATAAIAIVAFVLLAPDRLPKLATLAFGGGGAALLIEAASERPAIVHGLTSHAARSEGASMIAAVLVVCAGVALAQAGIALAERHGRRPRALVVPRRAAALTTAAVVVAAIVAALAADAPGRVDHAWQKFKSPHITGLTAGQARSFSRLGSISGNGRYQLWTVAAQAGDSHPLLGTGPGTFEFSWAADRKPGFGSAVNAHSLYMGTYAEAGIIGVLLLGGALLAALLACASMTIRARGPRRTLGAAVTAAGLAFCVETGFDWMWQVSVIPVVFLLLSAALLASGGRSAAAGPRRGGRLAGVVVSLAALAALAIPLATTNSVRASQADARARQIVPALHHARTAAAVDPSAASPPLQQALVLELDHRLDAAAAQARKAVAAERRYWKPWLVLSRIEAERGHAAAATRAYRHARALNPTSPLFNRR